MKGYVHIYCGDGKGKTTAAVGLAVRAAGRGKKVLVVRFLKNQDSGEVTGLSALPQITVQPCTKEFGFYRHMTETQKEEAKAYYQELLESSWQKAKDESFDLLILDEIMAACNYKLIKEERLLELLSERADFMEIIMTGRNPSKELMEIADYVSEIKKVKHPYDHGIGARKGIEY